MKRKMMTRSGTPSTRLTGTDMLLAQCWKKADFSIPDRRQALKAVESFHRCGKLGHLELAKRAFLHDIRRLARPVLAGQSPLSTNELLLLAENCHLLQEIGALSWMEQEEAFTLIALAASRDAGAGSARAKIAALRRRIAIKFKRATIPPRRGDYAIRNGEIVLFYGDSITSGYGPEQRSLAIYPMELEKLHAIAYPERRALFINIARGGEGVASATARAHEIRLFKPSLILMCYGANGPITETFGLEYLKLIESVRANSPGARLYLLSLTWPDDALPLSQKGAYSQAIFRKKQALIEKAIETRSDPPPMIDVMTPLRRLLAAGKRKCPSFTLHEPLDGAHPYEAGATLIAHTVFKELGGIWDY